MTDATTDVTLNSPAYNQANETTSNEAKPKAQKSSILIIPKIANENDLNELTDLLSKIQDLIDAEDKAIEKI